MIDFMIIGFGRCGTTTLFENLRRHPEIWMPRQKECPFIAGETRTEYERRFGLHKSHGREWKPVFIGAATPQWMPYPTLFSRWYPSAKVIAITRDPMDRAYSHYKMMVRRGEEKRPWVDILKAERIPGKIDVFHGVTPYFEMSNYSQWTDPYRERYGPNYMECKLEDLLMHPNELFTRIHNFLGVSEFKSPVVGVHFNVGYAEMNKVQKFLKRIPFRQMVPKKIRSYIWWVLEQIGAKKNG